MCRCLCCSLLQKNRLQKERLAFTLQSISPFTYQAVLGWIDEYLNAENKANQELHSYDRESRVRRLIESEHYREEDKKGIDVPFLS